MLLPYNRDHEGEFGTFTTDNGTRYKYYFIDIREFSHDAFDGVDSLFEFGFEILDGHKNPPYDPRIRLTIWDILDEFFHDKTKSIYFTCSVDGKESIRNRKFKSWFDSYPRKDLFIRKDYTVTLPVGSWHVSHISLIENPNYFTNNLFIENFISALSPISK